MNRLEIYCFSDIIYTETDGVFLRGGGVCFDMTAMSHFVAIMNFESFYKWAFVLSEHSHKFCKDVSSYGISCIPVPDFESEILQCRHPDLLPYEFSDLLWIDDGVCYLNPKHFFVVQFVRIMEST